MLKISLSFMTLCTYVQRMCVQYNITICTISNLQQCSENKINPTIFPL